MCLNIEDITTNKNCEGTLRARDPNKNMQRDLGAQLLRSQISMSAFITTGKVVAVDLPSKLETIDILFCPASDMFLMSD